jgi:hypothetical protein
MRKEMLWVIPVLLVVWIFFGDPKYVVATWFWPTTQAPWENVHAFYYPDSRKFSNERRVPNINSLLACRAWVDEQFRIDKDPSRAQGTYECGVGCEPIEGGVQYVCRLTVRD